MSWKRIKICKKDLNLRLTLMGGQSFRWKQIQNDSNEEMFIGVFANVLWKLKQNENCLLYKIEGEIDCDEMYVRMKLKMKNLPKLSTSTANRYDDAYYERLLKVYFRLDINLFDLYKQWEKAHSHFKEISKPEYLGVRVLNQAVTENIISFICSQNNNIKRISNMVSKLCEMYGRKIKQVDGADWYSFPNIEELSDPEMELKLRNASFGYRAKYIANCVKQIKEKGEIMWFSKLQAMTYNNTHSELLSLSGIGPKVADCICIMSLGHLDAIPVDTHVFQIAKMYYLPDLKSTKTVTPKVYEQVGNTFRKIYGPYAGWAQTVLFCADLKQFQVPKRNLNADDLYSSKKKLKLK